MFSFSSGVIHTYYTVALAPAIAALVGMGGALLWQNRHRIVARAIGAVPSSPPRCGRSSSSIAPLPTFPWLRALVLAAGILAAAVSWWPPSFPD